MGDSAEVLNLRSPIEDGALEPALIEVNAQAAEVCFNRHHTSPLAITIASDAFGWDRTFEIAWEDITEMRLRSHANQLAAAENGAYAVSIAALRMFAKKVTTGRSPHRSGADYLVVPQGAMDFEAVERLEVHGTETNDESLLVPRLRGKIRQLKDAPDMADIPGTASVVAFRLAKVLMEPAV